MATYRGRDGSWGDMGVAGGAGVGVSFSGPKLAKTLRLVGGDGGYGGYGVRGTDGAYIVDAFYYDDGGNQHLIAHYEPGTDGDDGAGGGNGGGVMLNYLGGKLASLYTVVGEAGDGGAGGAGGDGGAGGNTYNEADNRDGVEHDSTFITGAPGGLGGDQGFAGAGANAIAHFDYNVISRQFSGLYVAMSGGAGGSGGGQQASGHHGRGGDGTNVYHDVITSDGAGGDGAAGGPGGSAHVSFLSNAGKSDNDVTLQFRAEGGDGGAGGDGGLGGVGQGDGYQDGVHNVHVDYVGSGGIGGAGGDGGNAFMLLASNTITSRSLFLSAFASAGSGGSPGYDGGQGFSSSPVGLHGAANIYFRDNTISTTRGTALSFQGDGPTELAIENNSFKNFDQAWGFSLQVGGIAGMDIVLDVNAHTLTVNGSVNQIDGYGYYAILAPDADVTIVSGTVLAKPAEGLELLESDASGGTALHDQVTLTFTDANVDEAHSVRVGSLKGVATTWGSDIPAETRQALQHAISAAITADTNTGVGPYGSGSLKASFDLSASAIDFLHEGEDLTARYTVTLKDAAGGVQRQTIDLVIHGSDSAGDLEAGTHFTAHHPAPMDPHLYLA